MKWPFRLKLRLTFLSLIIMTLLLTIPLYFIGMDSTISLSHLMAFLQQNRLILLGWRCLIVLGLFLIWPSFIRYRAREANWPPQNVQKAIHLRYGLVIFLLGLDGLFQWSAGG